MHSLQPVTLYFTYFLKILKIQFINNLPLIFIFGAIIVFNPLGGLRLSEDEWNLNKMKAKKFYHDRFVRKPPVIFFSVKKIFSKFVIFKFFEID